MVRIAIEAPNDFAIDQWAIGWLKSRNYVVAPLENWESPKQLCQRLKVSSAHLSSTLKDRRCPKPLDEIRGESGRLSYLVSHGPLDQFIRKHNKHEPGA